MGDPRAVDVCKRFWISPLPYLSIIAILIGALSATVTLTIGYYMAYRDEVGFGLCFERDLPGIRRACILDLGGGVMSMHMVLGILLLIIEFSTVYINTKDWKITIFLVKIVLAVIATIELGAVTIQGAASYAEYRYDDGTYYKGCDFYSDESQHDPDVNFLTIVIVIGTATLFWVVLLEVEVLRLCMLLMGKKHLQTCILGSTIGNSNIMEGTEADHELEQLSTASPEHSEA